MRCGGVGWYPQSGFLHIDTGPVRNWDLDENGLGSLLFDSQRLRFSAKERPTTTPRSGDFLPEMERSGRLLPVLEHSGRARNGAQWSSPARHGSRSQPSVRGDSATDATLTACGPDCGMDDLIKTADEIQKAELRESVKQVLMHLLDDPQIQQKIVVLVQKQLRS
jgi:hypothetical protein